MVRHQQLKHAAAPFLGGGLLVGVLNHVATCRSTLKIGLGFFGGEISDQNINPIPEHSFVRDRQCSGGQMLHP